VASQINTAVVITAVCLIQKPEEAHAFHFLTVLSSVPAVAFINFDGIRKVIRP